jgi:hypothetical protein
LENNGFEDDEKGTEDTLEHASINVSQETSEQ